MLDYLYIAFSWTILIVVRIFLILLGLLLSPLIMMTRKVVPNTSRLFRQYRTNENWHLVKFHKAFWIWSNDRDGVQYGDTRGWYYNYAKGKGWSDWMMSWHWSFIRNPVNNLRFVKGVSAYMPEVTVSILKGQPYVDDSLGNTGFQILKGEGPTFNYYTLYYVAKDKDGISPWIIRLGHKIKMSHNSAVWDSDNQRAFNGFKGMTFRINRKVDIR